MTPYETTSVAVVGGLRVVVVVDPVDGAVVASGFGDLATTFGFLTAAEQARGHVEVAPDEESVRSAVGALTAYAAGDVDALEKVVVRQPGGAGGWCRFCCFPSPATGSCAPTARSAATPTGCR